MRISYGLFFSIAFHLGVAVFAFYWAGTSTPTVSLDRPVYSVDLVSLAPPAPPKPAPVVEVASKQPEAPQVPVVEASPETAVEVKAPPVVEAEPEVEKISPKKVEKKTVVKKAEKEKVEPKPKPQPKPKPKPKPQKSAEQLLKEGLAAAQGAVKRDEKKKQQALQNELAALKKKEGDEVYSHGGQEDAGNGTEGGVVGGTGSGLSEVYALIVGVTIKRNWRYPSFAGEANLMVSIELSLAEDGKIIMAKVIEPSGNLEFDNSALRAIRETEYVEPPRTKRDQLIHINFNSQELSE